MVSVVRAGIDCVSFFVRFRIREMAAEKLTNVELESIRLLDSKARTVQSEALVNFDVVSTIDQLNRAYLGGSGFNPLPY